MAIASRSNPSNPGWGLNHIQADKSVKGARVGICEERLGMEGRIAQRLGDDVSMLSSTRLNVNFRSCRQLGLCPRNRMAASSLPPFSLAIEPHSLTTFDSAAKLNQICERAIKRKGGGKCLLEYTQLTIGAATTKNTETLEEVLEEYRLEEFAIK